MFASACKVIPWLVLASMAPGCAYQKTRLSDMEGGLVFARLSATMYSHKMGADVQAPPRDMVVRVWDGPIDCGEGRRCDGMLKDDEIDIVARACLSDTSLGHELAHYYSFEAFGNYGGRRGMARSCRNEECINHADPMVFRGRHSFLAELNRTWRESQCGAGRS